MRRWRGRSRRKTTSFLAPGRCFGAPLTALLLLLSAEARGDQETIVRVRSSRIALDERLSAELSTLGLPIRQVEPLDPGTTLEEVARASGARAAVRVLEQENAIELWVEPRRGADPPIHQLVPVDPRRGWNLAAVSALEILRADLLEVRDEPAPLRGPPAPDPLPRPSDEALLPMRTKAPWLWAHVAAGAESSPGGLGVSSELLGEVRIDLTHWFDVAAFGAFSPSADQVTGREGVANVRHAIVGAGADARARWRSATASLGIAGVVAVFAMNGEALAPGYAGQSASIVTAGPMLRVGAALDVAARLRVRMEIGAGLTVPHAVIRFAGREVADWGQPFGLATLGLELGILE
jgi:hypothetical protein